MLSRHLLTRHTLAVALLVTGSAAFANQSQHISVSDGSGENTIVITNGGQRIEQHSRGNGNTNSVVIEGDDNLVSSSNGNNNVTIVSGNGVKVTNNSSRSAAHSSLMSPARPSGPLLKGTGKPVTREYVLKGPFDAIALTAPVSVAVVEGPVAKVTLTVDENLQSPLTPIVKNRTLYIVNPDTNFRTADTPVAILTVPHLAAIRAFHGAMLHLENIHAAGLEVLASDGAHVTASGTTRSLRVNATDGASVEASGLKAGTGDIIAMDHSSVTGFVSGDLRVHGSDGAKIDIQGHPHVLSADNENAGKVSIQ
jgi:hypothetical protein